MSEGPQAGSASKSGAPDPLIGRTINERFKISGLIARGGMGKVYRAEQAPLGRKCAVKVLNPNYSGDSDPEFHKRFFLEASIASKLTHPNTVTIFDYGKTDDEIYYMAMELLEGVTLHRAIRENGPFPEDRAAHVGRQICRALREAHTHGVIHRDLKPANIFLVVHGDEPDFVKVLDFGLVKNVSESRGEDITQTGLFMGSPKYMAPEQINGDRVDARTDIYSLGIILYEMMTGKVPFDRPNSVNILMAQVNEAVPPMRAINPHIDVSPGMEEAIFRCLEKDMERRFSSMDELLQSLKRVSPTNTGTMEVRSADASASIPPVSAAMRIAAVERLTPPPPAYGTGPWPSQTPPAMQDISVSMAPPPRSRAPLVAAIVLGVALAASLGALGVMRTRAARSDARGATVGSPPATATAARADVPALPGSGAPAELLVKVRINTEPEGASVKEDGVEVCNSTPCDVLYKGADADVDHEHRLAITRGGFKPEQRAIKVGDSPVFVKLAKAPGGGGGRPALPPPTAKPDDGPKGFKDIPY
jgi:eukaryotic-like serine/threonine-protein kinase